MMDQFPVGLSSIEVSKTSRGYTWSFKLYFSGNKMRDIREILKRVKKTREELENILGEKLEKPDQEKQLEKAVNDAEKGAKPK